MGNGNSIKVWDGAVRLFHWSVAVAFAAAYLSEDALLGLHAVAGYAILGLVMFRLLWGVIGTAYARFTDFVRRPAVVLAYLKDVLRGRARRHLGHNPAGGAMVLALLFSLLMTAGSGVVLYGVVEFSGPLAFLSSLSDAWASRIEHLHEFFANFTLALAGVHVLGVLVACLQHRENLVRSMFTGYKAAEE